MTIVIQLKCMTMDSSTDKIAKNTIRISQAIHKKMPHLPIRVWDISEFLQDLHDIRRNMVFIETDPLALEEVVKTMTEDAAYRDYIFYIGKRKPLTINETWAAARSNEIRDIVVIVGRTAFKQGISTPPIEHRLVDILAYSLRGWLPLPVDEAIRALAAQIRNVHKEHNSKIEFQTAPIHYGELMRYADRRYIGPIIEMIIAGLVENGELEESQIDEKYYKNGLRLLKAVQSVKEL